MVPDTDRADGSQAPTAPLTRIAGTMRSGHRRRLALSAAAATAAAAAVAGGIAMLPPVHVGSPPRQTHTVTAFPVEPPAVAKAVARVRPAMPAPVMGQPNDGMVDVIAYRQRPTGSSATVTVKPLAGDGGCTSASPVAAQRGTCSWLDVDDAMDHASRQYSAGFSKAALHIVSKALECRQDARMYRIAAMYACAAHDVSTARAYFVRVPAGLQRGIEQKCRQEGLDLRAP